MSTSRVLKVAMKKQLEERTKKDADGNWLCRRCGNVVPEQYKIIYYVEGQEQHVWGPCCSDECICYSKICSGCGKDFFVEKINPVTGKLEIDYYGDGISMCEECHSQAKSCDSCGSLRTTQPTPDGSEVCEKCFKEKYTICSHCNIVHLNEEIVTENIEYVRYGLDLTSKVCTGCFSQLTLGKVPRSISECTYCSKYYPSDEGEGGYCPFCVESGTAKVCAGCHKWDHDFMRRGSKSFCSDCSLIVVPCDGCGVFDLPSKHSNLRDGGNKYKVCDDCTTVGLESCPICLSLRTKGGECHTCFQKLNYCPRCEQFHFGESDCRKDLGSVMNYSYKPVPFHNYINSKKVFFGFENEINYLDPSDMSKSRKHIYTSYKASEIYLKSDGSINGPGFEVVSAPMTLEYFNEMDLNPLFTYKPALSDDSCGLHVHVSKKAFDGPAHTYKFVNFINTNKDFITIIAGRSVNSYCRRFKGKKEVIKGVVKKQGLEKYQAVNLSNPNTYEIRVFKGAKTEFSLRMRVEFTLALVEYTRDCPLNEEGHEGFVKWVNKDYPNLNRFFKIKYEGLRHESLSE